MLQTEQLAVPAIEAVRLRGASGTLYKCEDEEVLIVGPAGSSKTIGAMKKLIDACYRHPGSHHLLCRQTRKSLTDSTLVTFESILGKTLPEVTRVARQQRHSYNIHGSEIVCAGLDEPSKAFGSAWGLVVVEEAFEVSLDAWELFLRSMRDPELRKASEGDSFPYHQLIAVTNPDAAGHWLNKRASEPPKGIQKVETYDDLARLHAWNNGPQPGFMRRLLAVHQDNPAMFDTKAWRWTEKGEKYLLRLSRMGGHRRARMLEGRWCAAEGSVFGADFDESRNVCKPFKIPADWPIFCYLDPGYDHACGCFWVAVSPTGRRFVVAELYLTETRVAGIAQRIRVIESDKNLHPVRRYMDPMASWSKTAINDGVALVDRYQEEGFNFQKWPRLQGQEKDAGVDEVRDSLHSEQLIIFDTCVSMIMELQSWSYKRNTHGERPPGDDQYQDKFNDLLDGLIASEVMGHQYTPLTPVPNVIELRDATGAVLRLGGEDMY